MPKPQTLALPFDPNIPASVAEYLAFEAESETKHEFFDGEIIAMTGARPEHNKITARVLVALSLALRPRGCEIVASDQRVRVGSGYVYPDLVVTCGEERFTDDNPPSLLNPLLLVEVLSASTKGRDLDEKVSAYLRIESLEEYWIVSPDAPRVRRFARRGGEWLLVMHEGLGATLTSDNLGVTLLLATLYEGIPFAGETTDAPGGDGADTVTP